MNTQARESVERIVNLARKASTSSLLIAIVGSSSPLSKEMVDERSDIDLLVLGPERERLVFLDDLGDCLPEDWCVVNTWGVVSPVAVGAPVVHVHSTDLSVFASMSMLFRRSVAKYPSIVGARLSDFGPKGPISCAELLDDRLGLSRLRERVRALAEDCSVSEYRASGAAEPVDVALYCALHCVRNTLRWLGAYMELSPVGLLDAQWEKVCGPNAESLRSCVAQKLVRRRGSAFTVAEQHEVLVECHAFLDSLFEWIWATQCGVSRNRLPIIGHQQG